MQTNAPYLSGDLALETMAAVLAEIARQPSRSAPSAAALEHAVERGWIDRDGAPTARGLRMARALNDLAEWEQARPTAA